MWADDLANRLVVQLRRRGWKIVFAESCTGGMAAATITRIPGVSDCFCGSAVTYLNEVKQDWLRVDAAMIAEQTAVCGDVAKAMAMGVLNCTEQADISAAITGHLGPGAPHDSDGVAFIAIANRHQPEKVAEVIKIGLQREGRTPRQREATAQLFHAVLSHLEGC